MGTVASLTYNYLVPLCFVCLVSCRWGAFAFHLTDEPAAKRNTVSPIARHCVTSTQTWFVFEVCCPPSVPPLLLFSLSSPCRSMKWSDQLTASLLFSCHFFNTIGNEWWPNRLVSSLRQARVVSSSFTRCNSIFYYAGNERDRQTEREREGSKTNESDRFKWSDIQSFLPFAYLEVFDSFVKNKHCPLHFKCRREKKSLSSNGTIKWEEAHKHTSHSSSFFFHFLLFV